MRLPLIASLGALAVLAAGCDGENGVHISSRTGGSDARGVLKVVDTLQCPETLGVLTRKGTAQAGGTVCIYSGPRGAEVSLHLVALGEADPVEKVLTRFETLLAAAMPRTVADLKVSQDAEDARIAADAALVDADAARVAADAALVEADAAAAAARSAGPDRASVRLPGVAVEAQGDTADVRLPGLTVNADGDRASVRIGNISINADDSRQSVDVASSDESVSVQAHDDAARIRTQAPGDAVRTTYRLTDSRPSDAGWRMVGYEARGPAGGPIVVATVRSKERDSDGVFDSARDLVTLNVGE
ncbi:methyltransferase type 11 [Brevundimonas sp. LM2]|uniref:methyltransferase type 11 n=1 Tax=Brevundimonas sp. LM2 TaxID=1938605 RepID=UPI0009840780|nr:methyltransferase type 11 [Brevundimonas sp. LM2]AQR61492.1 methyltransferase type 11 [Brevundimonas sp. LM2]